MSFSGLKSLSSFLDMIYTVSALQMRLLLLLLYYYCYCYYVSAFQTGDTHAMLLLRVLYFLFFLLSFFLFLISLYHQNLHSLVLPGNKRGRIETNTTRRISQFVFHYLFQRSDLLEASKRLFIKA